MDAAKEQKGHGDTSSDTAVPRRKAEQNGLVVYASAAIIKRKEPTIRIAPLATGYRLCV